MMRKMEGKAWVFGDNINTDIISPPQYMELSIAEASRYAMSAVRPEFAAQFKAGDLVVAGRNMGSGSSRETSPLTLKHLGISAVVAVSFARIFFRNCINVGIPAIECPDAGRIRDHDHISVELGLGVVRNVTRNETYACARLPGHIMSMIECNGLIPYLLRAKGNSEQPSRSSTE